MKLYVVMQGEYSDRTIMAIFADEEKAKNYCRYHGDELYGHCYYSEYETSDDEYEFQRNGYYRCYVDCSLTRGKRGTRIEVERIMHELMSAGEYERMPDEDRRKSVNVFRDDYVSGKKYFVTVLTYLREGDVNDGNIGEILRKVGYDTCSEVAALFSEGYNLRQIRKVYEK